MADKVDSSLSSSAMGGAGKMGAGVLARAALQVLSIVVLARLLSPEDYGLVAMVLAIIAVAAVLRDFGLTFASVQSREMSSGLRSNLFWVNALVGAGTFIVAFLASWPISWIYNDSRLVAITWCIAPVYLLNALAGQYQADLNRQMKFGRIVIAEVGSTAVALGVAICAALLGAGYWALVIQQLASALIMLVLVVYFGGWLPNRYDRSISVRKQVVHGFDIFLSQIINYASKNADTVILGIRLEATSVGLYDRAYQIFNTLISQINQPSTRVALPVLSRLQDDVAEFRRYILRGQLTLMYPLMFVMSLGTAFGGVLIPFVLGDHWQSAALPFQILCVAGLAQASNYAMYWAYLATGRIRENVKLMMVWKPITIVLMILGSNWGVVGVAVAFALGNVGSWLLQLWWAKRVPITPRKGLLFQACRAWLVFFPAGILAALLVAYFGTALGIATGVVAYTAWVAIVLALSARTRGEAIAGTSVLLKIAGKAVRRRSR